MKRLLFILGFITMWSCMSAQEYMVICKSDGTVVEYDIKDIGEVSFRKEVEDELTVSSAVLIGWKAGSKEELNILCNTDWTIVEIPTWLNASRTSGKGYGTVVLTALSDNKTSEARSGKIVVATKKKTAEVVVTQINKEETTLTVVPQYLYFREAGDWERVSVTCNTDWTIGNLPSWLKASAMNGSGNGTVTFTTTEDNIEYEERTGTITFSADNKTAIVNVIQEPSRVNPPTLYVEVGGKTVEFSHEDYFNLGEIEEGTKIRFKFDVDKGDWDFEWRVNDKWAEEWGPNFEYVAKPGDTRIEAMCRLLRSDRLVFYVVNFTVKEKEPEVELNVTAESAWLDSQKGAYFDFDVICNTTWTLSGVPSWLGIEIDGKKYEGYGNIVFLNSASIRITTLSENPSTTDYREATITITAGDKLAKIIVKQMPKQAILSASATTPDKLNADAGSNGTFKVTCNTNWTISDKPSWLTVSPTSGYGDATITIAAQGNTSTSERIGNITIKAGGKTASVKVTQAGKKAPQPVTVSVSNTVTLKDGYTSDLTFSSNAVMYYEACMLASEASGYSDEDIMGALVYGTDPLEINSSTNFLMTSGLQPSTQYVYFVFPVGTDYDGEIVLGDLKRINFTTKVSSTASDAIVSGLTYTSTKWSWNVKMNTQCSKFYMYHFEDDQAVSLGTLGLPDIFIAKIINNIIGMGLSTYNNGGGYSMSSTIGNCLVVTWGMDSMGTLSGNISTAYNGKSTRSTQSVTPTKIKKNKSELPFIQSEVYDKSIVERLMNSTSKPQNADFVPE